MMFFLLAKYTLLFLMASVLGFILGHWWSRRNFVDVSESYEDLRKATQRDDAKNWDSLWDRLNTLPAPKETDLSPLEQRLDGVSTLIQKLPTPEKVSFAAIESRIDTLAKKVDAIPAPKEVSFAMIESHIDTLAKKVDAIPAPEKVSFAMIESHIDTLAKKVDAIPAPADLSPVKTKLADLETTVRNIPKPAAPKDVDLQPVKTELSSIQRQIRELPKVDTHDPVDLAPLAGKIESLEQRVSRIPRPEKVDVKPIANRLQSVETELARLGKRLSRPQAQSATPREREPSAKKRAEPRILSAALYGKKDNLRLISGVGPKLENLLNKNGVYYFWQVASWSRSDIKMVDERLDSFKGRILRDDWVRQAKELKRSPDSASMPANV
jgi:predicted flap endonuclease-1-like 5' DNA nuclease